MDCNVIHVIRCYFNEVANIEVHLISLPLAYSVAIGPLPDTLGQMVNWWIWSLCILMPALSVMLSCFQLAYVRQSLRSTPSGWGRRHFWLPYSSPWGPM